jgi:hypothetical protein
VTCLQTPVVIISPGAFAANELDVVIVYYVHLTRLIAREDYIRNLLLA